MSTVRELACLTRIELNQIIKNDRTKSLLIYFIGLVIFAVILTLLSGASSAYLGIMFIGICFMNMFYAPGQFSFHKRDENEGFEKPPDMKLFVLSKLLVLWLFNALCFLLLIIIIFLKFGKEEIAVFISYFIYCFGFVSPLDIILSGFLSKIKSPAMASNNSKYKTGYLAIGLLPIIPFPIIIIMNSHQEFTMKVFALLGLIAFLFTPRIIKSAEKSIRDSYQRPISE